MDWTRASQDLCDLSTEVGELRSQQAVWERYGTAAERPDPDVLAATEAKYAEFFTAEEHAQYAADADDLVDVPEGDNEWRYEDEQDDGDADC